jgi:hypothetical protein
MNKQEILDAISIRQSIYCGDRSFVRDFLFTSDTWPNIHSERMWEWMNTNFEDHWIENMKEEIN